MLYQYLLEITRKAESIIDSKDYLSLYSILENYDDLFKSALPQKDKEAMKDMPFWCYGIGKKESTGE